MYFGYSEFEVEDRIANLWTRESSDLKKNTEYMVKIRGSYEGISGMYGISVPNSGEIVDKENLDDIVDRLQDLVASTVTVDGDTYFYSDCCYSFYPYDIPCYSVSALDAFREGDYQWTESANNFWIDDLAVGVLKDYAIDFGIYYDTALYGALSNDASVACYIRCESYFATIQELKDIVDMEDYSSCDLCIREQRKVRYDLQVANNINEVWDINGQKDYEYYNICRLLVLPQLLAQYVAAELDDIVAVYSALYATGWNIPNEGISEDYDIMNPMSVTDIIVHAIMPTLNLNRGVSNPYSWNNGPYLKSGLNGGARPYINESSSENLRILSPPLYDPLTGGGSLPAYPESVILGSPETECDTDGEILSIQALQHVFVMVPPSSIRSRVARDDRVDINGDPLESLDISLSTAEKVLYKMKIETEEVFSKGWKNSDSGINQHYAFWDDNGCIGTFGRALRELTQGTVKLTIIGLVLITALAIIFFSNIFECEKSMTVAALIGVIFILASIGAGLGATLLWGSKLNILQMWTLPFLFLGIGCDDMFLLISGYQSSLETNDDLHKTYWGLFTPITMTSSVNITGFALMLFVDIPIIREMAKTAMAMVFLLWLIVVTTMPVILKIDVQRMKKYRAECLCCVKATPKEDHHVKQNKIYKLLYSPMIQSKKFQLPTMLITVTLMALATFGYAFHEVGLDTKDFFMKDTQAGEFTAVRDEHFANWPTAMNFGKLDYRDADTQMIVYNAYEKVAATKHIQAPDTSYLWLASYATWGTDLCASSPYACGRDWGNGECEAEWVENTLDLKTEGGVCKSASYLIDTLGLSSATYISELGYCPVFTSQTEDTMQFCLAKWTNYSDGNAYTQPGIERESDGVTPVMPIRLSQVSQGMWATELESSDAYVKMIEDSRAFCDDLGSIHCWMTGGGYTYWEQYLSLGWTIRIVTICSLVAAFTVSFGFLIISIPNENRNGRYCDTNIVPALAGATTIFAMCTIALYITFGLTLFVGVKMSVFTLTSVVLSVAFEVEYAVHIVHRFMLVSKSVSTDWQEPSEFKQVRKTTGAVIEEPTTKMTSPERVDYAMAFLFKPTTMAFLTSTASVLVLGFAKPKFIIIYFFTPLLICMFVTYFVGVFLLPSVLHYVPETSCLTSVPTNYDDQRRMSLEFETDGVENGQL